MANSRDRQRKHKYNVPYGWYDTKLAEQGGVCAICGQPPNVYSENILRGLHIDHNHNTGQVRDLLCSQCNIAIGHLREDIVVLDKIRAYLLKWA